MAKFAYNNAKNTNTGHIFFKLNRKYHPWVFYKKDLNPYLSSKTAEELSFKLYSLIVAC